MTISVFSLYIYLRYLGLYYADMGLPRTRMYYITCCHMTVGAIKGRAQYCNAQAIVDSEVSDNKTSCEKNKTFEVSIFNTAVSYQLLARAPLLFGA